MKSSYLSTIKRTNINSGERWIVKYHHEKKGKHKIREVKQVHNPDEYRKTGRARDLHTKEQLITLLEKNKEWQT